MARETPLRLYTVGTLLKDNDFRRGVCSIASVCGGGGGSASWGGITGTITDQTDLVSYVGSRLEEIDLQAATDNGNITSNAVQVTGAGNFSATSSIIIAKDDVDGSGIYNIDSNSSFTGQMLFRSGFIRITRGTDQNFTIQPQTSSDPGLLTSERMGGMPAENSGEFTTLGQVTDLISSGGINNVVLLGPPPTATLLPNYYYTYAENDDITLDLPPVAGSTSSRIAVINAGTEIVTISSNAGGNDIFSGGVILSSITVGAGEVTILYNNSINWVVIV